MRTAWPILCLLACVLLPFAPVDAGEEAKPGATPRTTAAAADAIEAITAEEDHTALATLAGALDLDPWMIADTLCSRGKVDAAAAYAAVAPKTWAGGVAAFVERQKTAPTTKARRDALAAAMAASAAGKSAESLRIVDATDTEPDDVVSIRLLHQRAVDVARLGDPAAALDACLALIERVEGMDWPLRENSLLEHAAGHAAATRDYERSTDLWERAATRHRALGSAVDETRALRHLADMNYRRGHLADALSAMRRAMPLMSQEADPVGYGLAASALALYEEAAGDYAPALTHHEDALRLCEGRVSLGQFARVVMNASRLFDQLGDGEAALALTDRALSLLNDPRHAVVRARVLLNRAQFRMSSGDLDGADLDLIAAEPVFAAAGASSLSARTVGQRGDVLLLRKELDAAGKCYSAAIELATKLSDPELLAIGRIGLGEIALAGDEFEEAGALFSQALQEARAVGALRLMMRCHLLSARALLKSGTSDENALAHGLEAVALRYRSARGLSLRAGRHRGEHEWDVAFAAARRAGDLSAWFQVAESGRASALAESVGGGGAIGATTDVPWLAIEIETVAGDLAAAERAAEEARTSGALTAIRGTRERLQAAKERSLDLQDQRDRRRKLGAGLQAPSPPPLVEVRGRLQGRMIVVYHVGENRTDALVIAADGARLVDLGPTAAIEGHCNALSRAEDVTAAALVSAREALLDPLDLPREAASVLIVPDGGLGDVPFGALSQEHDVALIPSVQVWMLLEHDRAQRGTGVLAVGDPDYGGRQLARLPASRDEAKAVGTRVLVGREARESAFRETIRGAPRWRAIHLACHGVRDARHPSLSGLALTREGSDDGVLTARELLSSSVPADLAFLSACQAGQTSDGSSAAAVSIPGALLVAGCPRVVANVWKVDDAAARAFAEAFHVAWDERGASAAGALRQARAVLRSDERFSEPRHWAGWVLWGSVE